MNEIESILKEMGVDSEISSRESEIGFSYEWTLPQSAKLKNAGYWEQLLELKLKKSPIRCQVDNNSRSIYVEIPKDRVLLKLESLLRSEAYTKAAEDGLIIPVGKNMDDQLELLDLKKEKHLLLAGSTGMGKSTFLRTLFATLTYKHSPEELQFLFIDLKRVEFSIYRDSPYLYKGHLTALEDDSQVVVYDKEKAMKTLQWLLEEMERRFALFKKESAVSFEKYNEMLANRAKLPRIIVAIDEIADLMFAYKNDMNCILNELLRKAAVAGIHVILSTQCMSTSVITGLFKSCISARIAFSVSGRNFSKLILDYAGAEKLMPRGDALYMNSSLKLPMRVQTPYIGWDDSLDIRNVVMKDDNKSEEVYKDALRLVVEKGQASISLLQRNLPVGYNKASELIEWMEGKGYIGPFTGSRYREVYLTKEEFEELLNNG